MAGGRFESQLIEPLYATAIPQRLPRFTIRRIGERSRGSHPSLNVTLLHAVIARRLADESVYVKPTDGGWGREASDSKGMRVTEREC